MQVDHFLKTKQHPGLPSDLVKRFFTVPSADGKGSSLNASAVHSLVLYVGSSMVAKLGFTAAIAHCRSVTDNLSGLSPLLELFLRLLAELDNDGRSLLINAIANQLRYPNSHTYFYHCLLLSLFTEVKADSIREQITRVLFERLVVIRPHPWGLVLTFSELLKSAKHNVQGHEFSHCHPEIERLFKHVASGGTREDMVAAR